MENEPIVTMNHKGREFFRLWQDGRIECAPEDYEKALHAFSKKFIEASRPRAIIAGGSGNIMSS